MSRVLLAGESWSTTSIHTKGSDSFITSLYEEGAADYIAALEAAGHEVTFQPNHVAAERFPYTVDELNAFDVVVLSDIGANTLLVPKAVFVGGNTVPNRLRSLAEWVDAGGALLMVGGYLSFQGIEAKANYRGTPLADVLPVLMEIGDDREETPEGSLAKVTVADHPITQQMPEPWPRILGYHRLVAKEGTQVLATVGEHPLLVVGRHGAGRVAAFATDMGPHWLPREFVEWPGYTRLWQQLTAWLADGEGNTL
jgi:uncharacterized membrane protein